MVIISEKDSIGLEVDDTTNLLRNATKNHANKGALGSQPAEES